MGELPVLIEGRPKETLVLAGDHRPTWEKVLPMLDPVYIWADRESGLRFIRWRVSKDVADLLGMDGNTTCGNPGCGCGALLQCPEHGVYLIDTNWSETGWYFHEH